MVANPAPGRGLRRLKVQDRSRGEKREDRDGSAQQLGEAAQQLVVDASGGRIAALEAELARTSSRSQPGAAAGTSGKVQMPKEGGVTVRSNLFNDALERAGRRGSRRLSSSWKATTREDQRSGEWATSASPRSPRILLSAARDRRPQGTRGGARRPLPGSYLSSASGFNLAWGACLYSRTRSPP